jgi:hypothetical protein
MGLASALLGETNPFAQWLSGNRNTLLGLSSQALSGNWGSGAMQQGRQADDAYATQQKAEAERARQMQETAAWLRQMGQGQIADLIDKGIDPSEAMGLHNAVQPKQQAPLSVSPGETLLDPNTFEPIYTGAPDPKDALAIEKEGFDRESALWKEYMAAEPVKTYQALRNSYERIRQSAQTDSGPGDLGLIFNYMKMLDPGSVVREGEFATAENAGGVGQQITNLYNRVVSGERLTPELREQFVAAADRLYQEASANLADINQTMNSRATGWGVDPNRFIFPPETYEPLQVGVPTPTRIPGTTITRLP